MDDHEGGGGGSIWVPAPYPLIFFNFFRVGLPTASIFFWSSNINISKKYITFLYSTGIWSPVPCHCLSRTNALADSTTVPDSPSYFAPWGSWFSHISFPIVPNQLFLGRTKNNRHFRYPETKITDFKISGTRLGTNLRHCRLILETETEPGTKSRFHYLWGRGDCLSLLYKNKKADTQSIKNVYCTFLDNKCGSSNKSQYHSIFILFF